MLHESFIASVSSPPKLTSSQSQQLKDAGVLVHSYQPNAKLDQVFKKSVTERNSLAYNDSHIFAVQVGKAAVHVYSRETGSHEATTPFASRIHSCLVTMDGTLLALGAEGGGLYLWETCTGRLLSTAQAHLSAVTALAADVTGNFVLSGSDDSNIHVWSLNDLVSFPSPASTTRPSTKTPRHTLSGHRNGINALATGHSSTGLDIAVSLSKDSTAMIWNHRESRLLRTVLLPSTPLCLIVDPADRGFFAGCENGSIQLVDFFSPAITSHQGSIYTPSSTPFQPPPDDLFSRPSSDPSDPSGVSSCLSIALSYDTTTLLTGHANGKIMAWDVGSRPAAYRSTVADFPSAPVTNLCFLPVEGWPRTATKANLRQSTITKPRAHEAFSGPRGGQLTAAYTMNVHFPTPLMKPDIISSIGHQGDQAFARNLASPLFDDDLLDHSVADLQTAISQPPQPKTDGTLDGSLDFVSLAEPEGGSGMLNEEIAHLREQVEHLRKMQTISNRHVDQLIQEKSRVQKEQDDRRENRNGERLQAEEKAAADWGKPRQSGAGDRMEVDAVRESDGGDTSDAATEA